MCPTISTVFFYPIVVRHFESLAEPGIHVVEIGIHQSVTDDKMSAAREFPANDEWAAGGDFCLHFGDSQGTIDTIVVNAPHVDQYHLDTAVIAVIVIPVIAPQCRVHTAICIAEIVECGVQSCIFSNLTLLVIKTIIIQYALAASGPAPLVIFLEAFGDVQHLCLRRNGCNHNNHDCDN